MVDVKVADDLWASSMLPEGLIERWFVPDGANVTVGDPIVEVRIEDSLHEIQAPGTGRLAISSPVSDIIEPGSVIGSITS